MYPTLFDRMVMQLAWMLPRRLVYWTVVRAATHATARGWPTSIDDLTAMDLLERWRRQL